MGYETEGFYEIKASVCGNTHEARAFVGMTPDGCHVDTEEIEIMVDAEGCAAEDGPVVGTPEQCAATLQDFIDLGCHSFCLSGYLHDEEAERFGKWVMPILRDRNRERMMAA